MKKIIIVLAAVLTLGCEKDPEIIYIDNTPLEKLEGCWNADTMYNVSNRRVSQVNMDICFYTDSMEVGLGRFQGVYGYNSIEDTVKCFELQGSLDAFNMYIDWYNEDAAVFTLEGSSGFQVIGSFERK